MIDLTAPSAASWRFAETFVPAAEAAEQARMAARELDITPISQGAASLLSVLAASLNARAIVEVGTGTGVSALALFNGMASDGVLTSLDTEPQQHTAARQAIKTAGIASQRARLISGRALDILPNLRDGAYDMVFLDGDKLEAVEYVEQAARLLRSGGLLVLNDALWHGHVADDNNDDDETVIIREALESVRANDDFCSALIPVGDGLLLAVKA
ncbi:MAG: O-methyltransferase [Propionibacteriaceae bacterium]